jgi:hypothetical protein
MDTPFFQVHNINYNNVITLLQWNGGFEKQEIMNLLDASIEVSLAPGYPTLEFAASGGVLNPKRE